MSTNPPTAAALSETNISPHEPAPELEPAMRALPPRWQKAATARQKISKEDAKYQSTPKGDQRCDGCISFQPPSACKFVQGDISPSGWCELFAAKIPKDLKP